MKPSCKLAKIRIAPKYEGKSKCFTAQTSLGPESYPPAFASEFGHYRHMLPHPGKAG